MLPSWPLGLTCSCTISEKWKTWPRTRAPGGNSRQRCCVSTSTYPIFIERAVMTVRKGNTPTAMSREIRVRGSTHLSCDDKVVPKSHPHC